MRRHGWQRPLHSLQIVGMAVYNFLAVAVYTFLGLFLGNRIAEITALSVMFLFVRCTAIDPTDKSRFRKKKTIKSRGFSKINYGFILGQIVIRFFRRVEKKILQTFIRRRYLDPWKTGTRMEPLLPFPSVLKDEAVSPHQTEDDNSCCSLCDFEAKKHSKHCKICNRCVDGFDHHCRGMRTYDYILAMREENQSMELLSDSDFSSGDKTDFDSPEKPTLVSRFVCRGHRGNENPKSLSIRD